MGAGIDIIAGWEDSSVWQNDGGMAVANSPGLGASVGVAVSVIHDAIVDFTVSDDLSLLGFSYSSSVDATLNVSATNTITVAGAAVFGANSKLVGIGGGFMDVAGSVQLGGGDAGIYTITGGLTLTKTTGAATSFAIANLDTVDVVGATIACDSFNQAPGTDFNLGDAGNPAVLNFDGPNNFLTVGRINLATASEFIVSAGAAVTSDGPLAFVNAVGTAGALTIDGSLTVLDGLTCDGLSDITVSSTGTLTASAGDITIADATLTNQGTISVTTNTLATTGTGLIANSAGAVVSVGTGIISAAMTTAADFTLAVTAAASAQVTAALDFGLNAQVTVAAGADVAFAGVVSSADGFIATGATAADQIDFSADVSGSDAVFGSVHATVGAKANCTQSLSIEDGAMFEVASGADLYAPVIDVSDPNSELVVDGTVHLENSLGITETIAGGVVTVTADGVIMVEVAEVLINTGADLTINGDLTTDNGGFFVTGSGTAEVTFSGDVTGDGLDLSTVVATVATATSVTVDYFASADDVMLTVDGGLTVATAATLSGLVTVSSTGTFVSSALADLDASGSLNVDAGGSASFSGDVVGSNVGGIDSLGGSLTFDTVDVSAKVNANAASTVNVNGAVSFSRAISVLGGITGTAGASIVLTSETAAEEIHYISGAVTVDSIEVDVDTVLVAGGLDTGADVTVEGAVEIDGTADVSFGSLELAASSEFTVDASGDDFAAVDVSGAVTFTGSNQEVTVVWDSEVSTPFTVMEYASYSGTAPEATLIASAGVSRRALLQTTEEPTTAMPTGDPEKSCELEWQDDKLVVACSDDSAASSSPRLP